MTTPRLDLGSHTGRHYDKGRPIHWQILWHAASNLFFQKWWFPRSLRPRVLRAFGARVDDDVVIREDVRIHWPWRLRIDGPAWIGHGAWILNLEDVHIERDVCVSQEGMLCTGSHDRHDPAFEHTNAPITLRRGSWVCTRAIVLAGTEVGRNAIVTAGAVARGSVTPSTVVGTGQSETSGRPPHGGSPGSDQV